jgi:hypothetical protein
MLALAAAAQTPTCYNVVWDAPSADCHGSMPLGNGDIGLNAWAQPDGSLHLLISKTDAWDDNARLVKVGEVVVHFAPDTFAGQFRQELKLEEGCIEISSTDVSPGPGHDGAWPSKSDRGGTRSVASVSSPATIRIWVDANQPVVHVTTKLLATACIELWRTNRTEITPLQCSDIMLNRKKPDQKEAPMFVEPDTVLQLSVDRTRHRPETLAGAVGWYHHNGKSVGPEITARIQGLTGFQQADPILYRTFGAVITAEKGERLDDTHLHSSHGFDIAVLTQQSSTPERWLAGMDELIRRAGAPDFAAHKQWWAEFWGRSWVQATKNTNAAPAAAESVIPANVLPLRIGVDQHGGSKFKGEIRNVHVPASFEGSFTLEAEVRPAAGEKGRIFDKITPGGSDGFLLDAFPGNSLRLICGVSQLNFKEALPAGQWAHIVATADATGWKISINGQPLADSTTPALADEAAYVSQMYALQRFINACAGRGAHPIKYNGSIFTVAPDEKSDHDFRRWGPGYWWQNTRLPYLSMCAAGDFEMLQPLFHMYADELLLLCKYRTKLYCGHAGAFFPECIYFWGAMFSETYGWTPFEERTDKLQENRYHKWEWVGGLELCWFMLDYYDQTLDRAFLDKTALPFCREILTFFDQHYATGTDGKLVMHPAQACETWWECTNPMPELAGCIAVSERLLALSDAPAGDRAFWRQFRTKLPALPLRTVDGQQALAPAEKFDQKNNCENPELYAVFPFRLIALGKPHIEWGIEALHHRWDKGDFGWRQDDLFMAYLGLTGEARRNLVSRAKRHDKQSRFPAFWGPNYDWVPDQDHGGVLLKGLQSLLMQTDGRKIYLLPAWPRDWDCDFKLHAPLQTVITGKVQGGRLTELNVTPPERKADVILPAADVR